LGERELNSYLIPNLIFQFVQFVMKRFEGREIQWQQKLFALDPRAYVTSMEKELKDVYQKIPITYSVVVRLQKEVKRNALYKTHTMSTPEPPKCGIMEKEEKGETVAVWGYDNHKRAGCACSSRQKHDEVLKCLDELGECELFPEWKNIKFIVVDFMYFKVPEKHLLLAQTDLTQNENVLKTLVTRASTLPKLIETYSKRMIKLEEKQKKQYQEDTLTTPPTFADEKKHNEPEQLILQLKDKLTSYLKKKIPYLRMNRYKRVWEEMEAPRLQKDYDYFVQHLHRVLHEVIDSLSGNKSESFVKANSERVIKKLESLMLELKPVELSVDIKIETIIVRRGRRDMLPTCRYELRYRFYT
jgi:hypothetical protein